jgi:hypothetical protein
VYLAISAAYGCVALKSFSRGEYYWGCKYLISALVYACIAIAILNPCFMHPCTATA